MKINRIRALFIVFLCLSFCGAKQFYDDEIDCPAGCSRQDDEEAPYVPELPPWPEGFGVLPDAEEQSTEPLYDEAEPFEDDEPIIYPPQSPVEEEPIFEA
jgi:hypothetical protein